MTEGKELSNDHALQYISELVGEYMKTLPPPVRGPVLQATNSCLAQIAKAINTQIGKEVKSKK